MTGLVCLRHLHLPGLTLYPRASAIQDHLVRIQLDHKKAPSSSAAPNPFLLTFQTPPTYTCGRREIGALTPDQIDHLRADGKADFYEALRGGQTTFHGPGQLTAYLIISLQAHRLKPRTHVKLLEESVIATCASYGLDSHATENPGVWIGKNPDDRKLASVGVQLRRHVSSHGIGLNVSVDLSWFDRIIACGLVGKKATNIEREISMSAQRVDNSGLQVSDVASVFATNVAARLDGVDGNVDKIREIDVLPETPLLD